ncbi:MAG TPA: class 1 fructose-bisphosphatase [Candidatus Limnocylindrales bacterium]|nr:class 1 fructose-bisphosphatase [Candidatus Limnocylindrales bacterium]
MNRALDPVEAAPATTTSGRVGQETTLTEFIIGEQRRDPAASAGLTALVNDIRLACKRIATVVGKGALSDAVGKAGTVNASGDAQARLDVLANDIFLRTTEWGGSLAGMVSEELDDVHPTPVDDPRGRYLLAFDPLDGSSNIDVNVSVGSIFSVLADPAPDDPIGPQAFLQPGARQVCAGYAIYGPTTMLVLTLGRGVHGFTLDREIGEFILTHPGLTVPDTTTEFAINSSNSRFWEPAVARYVDECLAGSSGPRGRDFNMRWVASLVAEAHRILLRGGIFLYPRDDRTSGRNGKLRLLYEANPIGLLIEQAGGRASTGYGPILDVEPTAIHQRTGFVFGSSSEVERIEGYHRDHNERPFDAPLFRSRGLFRDPVGRAR